MDESDPANNLPDADTYLAKCFILSGVYVQGGMGISPLTWTEINAFISCSAYPLTGWEGEQLISMSRSYCQMASKAKSLGCPAPYLENVSEEEAIQAMRDKVSRQWESFGNGLKPQKRA